MNNNFSRFLSSSLKRNFNGLLESGARSVLGTNTFRSSFPNERAANILTPESAVIIKKKAFSTLNFNNDLKWLDTQERLLLRATKALFAYKVQQIKSYEAVTKYDSYVKTTGQQNLGFLAFILNELNLLTVDTGDLNEEYEEILSKVQREKINRESIGAELKDVAELARRFAFSSNFSLTTWHIDPESQENYVLGPGTGTIELTNYSSFSTNLSLDSNPSSFNLSMEDPYNLATILEDDIEFAISEAVDGAYNFFESLLSGSIAMTNRGRSGSYQTDISDYAKRFNQGSKDLLSSDVEYIRERLRTFYLGKPIVNPADGVHVFVNSNRRNLFSGSHHQDGSAVKLDRLGEETIGFSIDDTNSLDDAVLEAERRLFTNNALSFENYKKVRQYSSGSFGMFHIYAGVVNSASSKFSGGKYDFSFSASDNMSWLNWSRYQKVPALEDRVGVLEDPLTPFKIETDEFGSIIEDGAPELLDENKQLLENSLLSYNSGVLKGQQAVEGNLYQGQFNGFGSLDKSKILQHPDGMIYRWKKGIVTATAGFQSSSETGRGAKNNRIFSQVYGVTPAEDILANLDIANIISVLVTGQPYNIEKFIERSFEAPSSSAQSGRLNPDEPLSLLIQSIKKQNAYYGNFKPYRTVTMNKKTVSRSIQDKVARDNLNSQVVKLQKQKVRLIDQIQDLRSADIDDDNILIRTLFREVSAINDQIGNKIDSLKNSEFGKVNSSLTFNFSFGNDSPVSVTELSQEDEEKVTRAMLHVGSLRRIEDVRLNRDSNYLIVSDQYDYNLELTPFLLRLSQTNYKRFQGDYTSVFERCSLANKTIGFEFFANSQGHLEFRPPQWNRTPLTVLEYASKAKREGKTIIPDNIMSLFNKRIESLEYDIQKLNILIVMSSLLLGKFPDRSLIPGFKGRSGASSLAFYGVKFKIQDAKGDIDNVRRSSALRGASRKLSFLDDAISVDVDFAGGKYILGDTTTLIGDLDPLIQEQEGIFDDVVQKAIRKSKGEGDYILKDAKSYATAKNLNLIRKDCIKFMGFDPCKDLGLGSRDITDKDFFFGEGVDRARPLAEIFFDENQSIFKMLTKFISSRDSMVSILKRNNQKKRELESVEVFFSGEDSKNAKKLDSEILQKGLEYINAANDFLKGSPFDGNVFEHLVLNDRANILGPGSGKRFLIEDVDIISASYSERPPEFTRINVVGDVPLNAAQAANSATDGLYYWAGATDFDLWRQYGYKPFSLNSIPFLNDAELACKPYAYFKMQNQRAKINTGSLTVSGNEYYQPGDVVYVKSKNLLYYVESVSHSFQISGTYTTTLNLIYGHPPGEYLPGPLDVIGQQFYTRVEREKVLSQRSPRGDDNYRVFRPSSIIMNPVSLVSDIDNNFIGRTGIASLKLATLYYADNQTRFLRMITDANLLVSNRRKILIRAFIASSPSKAPSGSESVELAQKYLDVVKDMFVNPEFVTRDPVQELSLDVTDLSSGITSASSAIKKAAVGSLEQAFLPNGQAARPINESDIIIQICYLSKDKNVEPNSEKNSDNVKKNSNSSSIKELPEIGIQCLDRDLINYLTDSEGDIREEAYSIFPMGGPSQATWGDVRILEGSVTSLFGKSRVLGAIEVGIIDLGDTDV